MDSRTLLLAVPSALVLIALVAHSWKALPRRRALAFWCSVIVYGLLRGIGVRLITREGLGASVPYVLREPLFTVFGVSVQELCGWAIVSYLAWWTGWAFSSTLARHAHRSGSKARPIENGVRLFPQVLWGALFLGGIGWAVEAAAVSAGWWHWTVPASSRLLLGVPFIGIVDWFFVGIDFLLPFLVLTASGLKGHPGRWLSLLSFPLHFGGHVFTSHVSAWFPVPSFHIVHWGLLAVLTWLALRSEITDEGFGASGLSWVPVTGFVVVAADVAFVDLWMGRPELLASILPVVGVVLAAVLPVWGIVLSAGALVVGMVFPPAVFGAAPGLAAALVRWARPTRAWVVQYILVGFAGMALVGHTIEARREDNIRQRLDQALSLRAKGDLDGAVRTLADLSLDHPDSHAVHAFLGEIYYRTRHLDAARDEFLSAVRIKRDYLEGYRYVGVIDLQRHNPAAALEDIRPGLQVDPKDPELSYLAARAGSVDRGRALGLALDAGPAAVEAVAGLAFEVGDLRGADAALAAGLALWPEHRSFVDKRAKLAAAMGRLPENSASYAIRD